MGRSQVTSGHQRLPQKDLGRPEPQKSWRRVDVFAARLLALSFMLLALAACVTDGAPSELQTGAEIPTRPATAAGAGSLAPTPSATPGRSAAAVGREGPTQLPPTTGLATAGPAAEGVNVRGRVLLEGQAGSSDVIIEVVRITDAVRAETVAEGLQVPWALAFTPDGRILVTERAGSIRVIQNGVLLETPMATLEVASVSESGLMGIALHPDYTANRHFFVCYTYRDGVGQLRNRVARLTDNDGVGVGHRVILDDIPGARNHNGCRIRFGPDRKLYVTMGDAQVRQNAPDLESLSGKVLRLEADGSVPADNPFPGSYVYTYGHRNPQGMDWQPGTGELFITEHGPDRDDEINILQPGGDYGWPQFTGVARDGRYVDPILAFTPTVALAGAAFYTGDRLAATWQGNFIFATLKASHLHRVVLEPPEFRAVLSHQRLFDGEFGRLRAVAMSPDGYLYFTTSNRDGRGRPFPGDDKVFRLVPVPAGPPELYQPEPAGDFGLNLEPGTYQVRLKAAGFFSSELRVVVAGEGTVILETLELSRVR